MRRIPKLQIKHKWTAVVLYIVFGLCCLLGILSALTYFSSTSDVIKITGTVVSYSEKLCEEPGDSLRGSAKRPHPCYRPTVSYQYKNQQRTFEGARVDYYKPIIGAKQEVYVRENSRGEILATDFSQQHTPLIFGIILLSIFLPALLLTKRIRKRTLAS